MPAHYLIMEDLIQIKLSSIPRGMATFNKKVKKVIMCCLSVLVSIIVQFEIDNYFHWDAFSCTIKNIPLWAQNYELHRVNKFKYDKRLNDKM